LDEELYKREQEKIRVKSGKETQEAKKQFEQTQKEREYALRKKEKEDDIKAKQRIREKIEQDKRERAAQKQKTLQNHEEGIKINENPSPTSTTTTSPSTEQKQYEQTFIQVRMPNAETLKIKFEPTDTVQAVYSHMAMLLGNQNFALLTNFPKKSYSPRDNNLNATLKDKGLVPTDTFILKNLTQ